MKYRRSVATTSERRERSYPWRLSGIKYECFNKIYTKTGDAGQTGLVGGVRWRKAGARLEAIGAVDEANSAIGVVRLHTKGSAFDAMLHRIQHDLFDLCADLATPCLSDEKPGQAL